MDASEESTTTAASSTPQEKQLEQDQCTDVVEITALGSELSRKDQPTDERLTQEASGDVGISLLELASTEIEQMRHPVSNGVAMSHNFRSFPPACLSLLKHLQENHRCIDCGEQNPQWAACRYGALLCLHCSGQHRSLGVQVSSVRSISMDDWSVTEVVSMLEGGNQQIGKFFERHNLTQDTCRTNHTTEDDENPTTRITRDNVTRLRYKTKAALFYRRQMESHVANILASGPYRGREISRRLNHHPLEKRYSTMD